MSVDGAPEHKRVKRTRSDDIEVRFAKFYSQCHIALWVQWSVPALLASQ